MPPKGALCPETDDNKMNVLNGLVSPNWSADYSKKFIGALPEKIRQRVEVLIKYQEECDALQKEMTKKETELRRKYDDIYAPFFKRRQEIITGSAVTEEEVKKGFPEDHAEKVSLLGDDGKDVKGLPEFWLKVLRHHVILNDLIEEYDADVLKHLVNLSSRVVEGEYGSFEVTFTFEPNEYIEEEHLTLTLLVTDDVHKIQRSPLTWKDGKDVTVRAVTKKQRAKRTGQVRTVTAIKPRPSFFRIFKESSEDGDSDEEDEEEAMDDDQVVSLLHVLHNSIIPCAVNCYTGEAPDGSSDVEEETDEEDEENDEDDDEDDEDYARGSGRRRKF